MEKSQVKKITIEDLQRVTHKKDGEAFRTKKGERFCLVKVTGGDGVKYTAFDMNGWTKEWAIGKTIEVEAYEEEYEGTYSWKLRKINFVRELEKRVDMLERKVAALMGAGVADKPASVQQSDDVEIEDLNGDEGEKLPWEE